jgi:hypothetical protein
VIRIFSTLAVFSLLCLTAALFLGIYIGDLQSVAASPPSVAIDQATLDRAAAHRLAGVAAALIGILINSIAATYFIGTSRWCKEVAERYSLDRQLLGRCQALKRRTFPWAVSSMLVIVGIAALGAAADPGTGMENTAQWVLPHFVVGVAGIAFVALAFFAQATNIRAQYDVINEIVVQVRKIRIERGLEV